MTSFKLGFRSFCILIYTQAVKNLNALPADKHFTTAR